MPQRDAPLEDRLDPQRVDQPVDLGVGQAVVVAAALVEGQLTADQFDPEKLASPDILSLVDKSKVDWDEMLDVHWPAANPTTITMRTSAGNEFSETTVFPPGHPENPLPDEVLEDKFRQLTGKVLDSEQIEKIIELTRRLDQLTDVRALTDILRPRRGKKELTTKVTPPP